jgi:transposase
MQITTIGLDLAKSWFQVHGVDASGKVAIRRKLKRSEVIAFFKSLTPCLIGIEACATAHYWAGELIGLGHEVKLMPPAYVKAYVKRNKNDAADAEAICEAVTSPSMRFVPVTDAEQQSILMLHRVRSLLICQRTVLVNALRAHMAEFGMIAPQGLCHVEDLTTIIPAAARIGWDAPANGATGIEPRIGKI